MGLLGRRSDAPEKWLASIAAAAPSSADGTSVPILREIVLRTEQEAQAEARRQQEAEREREVEWIYLRRDADGVWVARRVPRNWEPPPVSKKQAFLEALLNPVDWGAR